MAFDAMAMKRRLSAIPWDEPIHVHFACDDKPLFGCRLCILRFGLKAGDYRHLFRSEGEALDHIASHAGTPDSNTASPAAHVKRPGIHYGD
jgi:hypothetical protein